MPTRPVQAGSSGTWGTELNAWLDVAHNSDGTVGPQGMGQLTGATSASRYVGGTTSGAPVSGTFAVGDFVVDRTGQVWECLTAGTPGTWTCITRSRADGRTVALGYIAETAPLAGGVSSFATAAGALRGTALYLRAGDIVTNIIPVVTVVAAGVAGSVNVGLLDSTYNRLAISGEVQAQFTTLGPRVCALTAPYTVTADGLYYPVFLLITGFGTTQPSLVSGGQTGSSVALAGRPKAHWNQNGQVSIPATATPGDTGVAPWFGVS